MQSVEKEREIMLSRVVRAIESLIYSPEQVIARRQKYLKDHKELRYFEPFEFDLGVARDKEEHEVYGDMFFVDSLDGIADIYLNEKDSKELSLYKGRKVYTDFWRFFITNVAQAGKILRIIIGKAGAFDVFDVDSIYRGFHEQWNGNDASKTIDLTSDYAPKSIRGHDFVVHNLGGTNISVAVDGKSAKTVKKYDVFSFYKTEWYKMIITNAGSSDVEVTIVGEEI